MPTLPLSPARSIHSWSFVYLKPAGYEAIGAPGQPRRAALLLSLVERHRHDARARALAADVDVELAAGGGVLDGQVRHADRLLQIRRLRPAGDDAGPGVADVDVVAVPRDAAVEHLEPGDLPRRPVRLLRAQRRGADEVVFLPADDPVQIRFHRGRRLIDVVAVKPHAGLEAQRVARAEAAGHDAGGLPRLDERQPHAIGGLRRD